MKKIFFLLAINATSFNAFSENMADFLKNKEVKMSSALSNEWDVKKGQGLRDIIYEWTKRDNWNLLWHIDYDIKVSADAQFSGTMQEAIGKLLRSINLNGNNLNAQLYPDNKVIIIKAGLDD